MEWLAKILEFVLQLINKEQDVPGDISSPSEPYIPKEIIIKPGYLSEHFSLEEMTISQTATRLSIDNTPSEDDITRMTALCDNCLEPIRVGLARSIYVSSGFRSKLLNMNPAIGGSDTSQHVFGEAADITCYSLTIDQLFAWILTNDIPFHQVIHEFSSWVHIGYKIEGNRGQVLLATKVNKKTVYTEVEAADWIEQHPTLISSV